MTDLYQSAGLVGLGLDPAARFDTALERYQAGKLDEVVELCREITAEMPSHGGAWHLLGAIASARGDYAYSLNCLERASQLDAGHPVIQFNLGNALMGLERYPEAVAAYRRALEIDPGDLRPLHNLALALKTIGELDEAEAMLRRATTLEPDNAEAQLDIARFLVGLGGRRDRDAETAFNQALELAPTDAAIHADMAAFYEHRSRLADAAAVARDGLALDSDNAQLHLTAAKLDRQAGDRRGAMRHLEAMRAAAATTNLEKDIVYATEMGRLLDDAGDPTAAFGQFRAANAAAAARWQVDSMKRQAMPLRIERLTNAFTPEWTARWSPATAAENAPVFLHGFARSGTTLLGTMLGAHPGFRVIEEQPASIALIRAVDALPGGEPEALAQLDNDQLRGLRDAYMKSAGRPDARILDKNPFNTINAGLLFRVFPDARFMLAVRHPCDVVLSCYMQHFQKNAATVHFLELADAARLYVQVMTLWRQYIEALPLEWIQVRYEDLVNDPERELRRLLAFADLDWSDAVMDNVVHARKRGDVKTPGYEQVGQPIYRKARGRWLGYRQQLAPVMNELAPWVEYFGYEPLS
jgi:tetratricopeptide (TPR) repeat protein